MNRFDEVKHEYFSNGEKLANVTSWLEQFFGEFNPYYIASARFKSKKNVLNLSIEEMVTVGDLRNAIAIDYGNSIHKTIELWIKYRFEPTQKHLLDCLHKFIEKYGDDYKSEVRIYNTEYMLGGTADLIHISENYLDDIKTNETLKSGNGYFKCPLDKIKNNNRNKAGTQLSVYEFLLNEGKKIKRVLNWDGDNWQTIELEDIDVSEIMKIRKQQVELDKLLS